MPPHRPRQVPLGRVLSTLRRALTRPERLYVVYDKEGTLINPRAPSYVYRPIEAILAAQAPAYDALIDELGPYLACPQLEAVPDQPRDGRGPYWDNGYFSHLDARVAYALTVAQRPRRIVEIGSGNSTKFFRKALDDFAIPCTVTAIDPRPRAELAGVADEVIAANVLDVGLEPFAALEAGDVLFVDGSHLVLPGTDSTAVFLEILPGLRPGVLVHVHDICLPYEYGELFSERLYGEQYLLACTLMDTATWRPLLPVHYLDTQGRFADLPGAGKGNTSFWMVKL